MSFLLSAPRFWEGTSPVSTLLLPLSLLYDAVRRARYGKVLPQAVGVPVVCIGNVVAGGAGKTPVALAVAGQLHRQTNKKLFFLSRGYGGRITTPTLVDAALHTSREVGDEPLLLARAFPTVIARDRVAGARLAKSLGAEIILMDDGFQNPSLKKDVSLLVVDGAYGIGNGRLLPAGPLREPFADALARADMVVLIGEDKTGIVASLQTAALPIIHASITPVNAEVFKGKRVLAFAGIARPEKFFATLAACGAEITERISFPDHHPYGARDIMMLLDKAAQQNALPVTTAKDFTRIPAAYRSQIQVLEITLSFVEEDALKALYRL